MSPTIMIVDDDPDDSELTKRVLVKSGRPLNLAMAPSGEAALTLLRANGEPPALLLVDLKMPGMNGIDLLRRIKADERLRSIPVITVTNSTLDADRQAALDAGADAFVHKALDLTLFGREIEAQLQKWLDR